MPRMTSKGQVTIPKRIRDHLGLKPGSEVEFVVWRDGQIVLKAKTRAREGAGSKAASPRSAGRWIWA